MKLKTLSLLHEGPFLHRSKKIYKIKRKISCKKIREKLKKEYLIKKQKRNYYLRIRVSGNSECKKKKIKLQKKTNKKKKKVKKKLLTERKGYRLVIEKIIIN